MDVVATSLAIWIAISFVFVALYSVTAAIRRRRGSSWFAPRP